MSKEVNAIKNSIEKREQEQLELTRKILYLKDKEELRNLAFRMSELTVEASMKNITLLTMVERLQYTVKKQGEAIQEYIDANKKKV